MIKTRIIMMAIIIVFVMALYGIDSILDKYDRTKD